MSCANVMVVYYCRVSLECVRLDLMLFELRSGIIANSLVKIDFFGKMA